MVFGANATACRLTRCIGIFEAPHINLRLPEKFQVAFFDKRADFIFAKPRPNPCCSHRNPCLRTSQTAAAACPNQL